MEDVVGGSSIKGGTKHKCQGYQLFKEKYVKKVFEMCLKDKKRFLDKCSVATSTKNFA